MVFLLSRNAEYSGQHKPVEGPTVSFILIDGLLNSTFVSMLQEKQLPVIEQLIEDGLYVKEGISSFPTMTGYAFFPFVTGMDATNSDIYGLRWFDRNRSSGNLRNYVGRTNVAMNEDVDSTIKTIFEYTEKNYTSSINTYMNRGVHHEEKTGWYHATSKYSHNKFLKLLGSIPFLGNRLVYDHFRHESLVLEKSIAQLNYNPKVQWLTFAAPDASVHIEGVNETYKDLIKHIDSLIGKLILASQKLKQERYFVIISDHGVETVNRNADIPDYLKQNLGLIIERGKSTNLRTDKLSEPLESLLHLDGFFVINGNLSAYLYLRKNGNSDWGERLLESDLRNFEKNEETFDIIKKTIESEAISLVAYKISNVKVGVETDSGVLEIENKAKEYCIKYISGNPLSYPDSILENTFMSKADWLAKTIDTPYPYAIPRIYDLVSKEDVGDLILCSSIGYDLANDFEFIVGNYLGGHGGIRKDMLSVPYIISGPDIGKEVVPYALAEDIGATIFNLLEIEPDYELDGRSLID
jgi:predicted AlkP superfamily pyrophosphatase or phosphodiesterase